CVRRALLAFALAAVPTSALAQAAGLPALPPPSVFELELEGKTHVREIRVEGVRALPAASIRAIVAPYEGKALATGDLREVARKLTQLYFDSGFVTSGVLIRLPPVTDGIAYLDAVEGTIEHVRFAAP